MTLSICLGVALGSVIGAAFAWLQLLALRRNELLESNQRLPGRLRQVPGSMGRVALLLMALVGVQVLFPSADKWWLSGSLVGAYALPFVLRLKERWLLGQR